MKTRGRYWQTIGNAVSQLYGYIFCMLVSNALTDMPLFGGALYLCGRMILVSGWVFSKSSRKLLPGNARKWGWALNLAIAVTAGLLIRLASRARACGLSLPWRP